MTTHPGQPTDAERAAFEAWMRELGHSVRRIRIDESSYFYYVTQVMWQAWQARALLATKASASDAGSCGIHYIGGLRKNWGCDVCGYKAVHDAHPGCRRPQPAESASDAEPSASVLVALGPMTRDPWTKEQVRAYPLRAANIINAALCHFPQPPESVQAQQAPSKGAT